MRHGAARGALVVAVLGLAVSGARAASAGDLDPGFGSGGKVVTGTDSGFDTARDVLVQPDGKVVAAGTDGSQFLVVRYTDDGALDAAFGSGGLVLVDVDPGWESEASAVALQPDGKLVVAGSVGGGGFHTDFALARLHPDGSLDASFGGDGTVRTPVVEGERDAIFDVSIDAQGRLVVAGEAWNGIGSDFAVARYFADGTLDPAFGEGGVARTRFADTLDYVNAARALVIQPWDGKIVAAGKAFPGDGGGDDFGLVRYLPDGTLDSSFGGDGRVSTHVGTTAAEGANDLVLHDDGKLVAVGSTSRTGDERGAVLRYAADGTLDASFGSGGIVGLSGDPLNAVALQPGGKVVVAGSRQAGDDFRLVTLASDGNRDAAFGVDGEVTTDFGGGDTAFALALYPDGRILAAGDTERFDGEESTVSQLALARYLVAADVPALSVGDVTVTEGDGAGTATLTVSLSAASTSTVTVRARTIGGTAVAGEDYEATDVLVSFEPGETSKPVAVGLLWDDVAEPPETFEVELYDPAGAALARSRATVTIHDDDGTAPSGACILVEPADGVDFGTAPFSTASGVVTRAGAPHVTVTNCGDSEAAVSVRATDAAGGGAAWTLDAAAANPCDAGVDVFGLSLGALRIGKADKAWTRVAAGAFASETASIRMPCTGSGGTGSTLSTRIVFTATS